jgi:SAM-dependent methyltransferase
MDVTGPSWSDIASWYDALLQAGSGPHDTALACLLRLVGPLEGVDALDIACGQGLATRALARNGARRVVGVDSSRAMLEIARRHHEPGDRVAYRHDDARMLATCDGASFDLVTCQLGLMDIPDLAATLHAVGRVLRPGGAFAFVIGHPCFLAPNARPTTTADGRPAIEVSEYLDERFWRSSNPDGVRRAGNHHRTLATYLNALVAAGLAIEVVEEPVATPLLAAQRPVYDRVPIFLAARTRLSPNAS